ncbi:glycosyltransferase [Pseudoxanthomonas winnipegensis]|uniref:class I SAM-dependent methyltransferase n=1 Tax=Pseudoxanthomonas winnipegensis TaxID=2480810 RepID=UPI00102DE273|nr:class I SAM-dependent methyltransferase [Pseudoxanthomonas winnipegensis]TAA44351.1 glycosyltransferase [Pseudoxanthomonas winnipegensis]
MIKLNKSASIRPHRLPPSAWHGHIPFAAWLVEELRPGLLVELGTHHGASYLGFCQAVSELALATRCYAIDTWEGDEHAAFYEGSVYEQLRSYHDEKYDDFSKLLRCTFDEGLDKFADGSVDLLHIDGLHTYEAVKHDYESWFPKLSRRAVVLFHDLEERQGDFGVWRLWSEVAGKYPSFSFTHSHGLGVLLVGEDVPESVQALARLDSVQAAVVSNLFATLGRGVQVTYDRDWWRKEVEKVGAKSAEMEARAASLQAEVEASRAESLQFAEQRGVDEALAAERQTVQQLRDEIEELKSEHEQVLAEIAQAQGTYQQMSQEQEARFAEATLESEAAMRKLQEAMSQMRASLEEALRDVQAAEDERVRLIAECEGRIAQSEQEREDEQAIALRQEQRRLAGDVRDRDELIASLAGDLHRAREALNTTEARMGRAIEKVRQRWAPDGSLIGRVVASAIRRAIVRHDKSKGRPAALEGELLKLPVGPAGTPTRALPKEFADYIDSVEPKPHDLEMQREISAAFDYVPLISFVVPIYRLPRQVLEQTLLSMEAQTYAHWEACLAWADSEDEEGWQWLQQRCVDKRYRLLRLQENGGISRNSNAALESVSGDFVALLDHDDTVTPWALFDMVQALQEHPDADFLYSDKDSITETGECRLNALFKPAWSPEMMHSVNYLTHFNLMRSEIVRAVGAWDPDTDGAQDWDIFFKVTAAARKVLRVPSIHYHWRILPTSTSTGLQTKPYAIMGQLRCQKNYFERKGLPAIVRRTDAGMFHVTWPVVAESVHVVVLQTGTPEQAANVINLLCASSLDAVKRITLVHPGETDAALLPFREALGERLEFARHDQVDWRVIASTIVHGVGSLMIVGGKSVGLSGGLVDELTGWTQHHPEIAWAGALAVEPQGKVLEAGRVMSEDGSSAPLFRGCYSHEYGWFGGALWYRNVRCVSEHAVAFKVEAFTAAVEEFAPNVPLGIESLKRICAIAAKESFRGLLDPFAVAYLQQEDASESWDNNGQSYWSDPYFSPAFGQVNPLRLK